MSPKVSILTPIYNTKEEWLRENIESVLIQTFQDFEFIILNDSPNNDKLKEIVLSYKDSRIKYFENEINLGISKSRNRLLDLAKGEYIAILDHDDICMPQRLEKQVKFLDENKEYGVISSNYKKIPKNYIVKNPSSNCIIKNILSEKMALLHTGMMIRKSIFIKNNIKYNEKFTPAEDYMLLIDLVEHTMFYNLPEVLMHYREDENNTTNLQKEKMLNADILCKIELSKRYPNLSTKNLRRTIWINIFNKIPFVKIKKDISSTTYYLFGLIPLIKIYEK